MSLPVELLAQLYAFILGFQGDHGLAIILLSLVINVVLLPAFVMIDRAREKASPKNAKMRAEIRGIKKHYTGRKRYYQTRAIHEQYGYSFRSFFKSSIGLFIQIPVFFLTWSFLSEYPNFVGHSFGFIRDLSEPDRFFYGYNVLPFAMFGMNILPAFLVAKEHIQRERNQTVVIAFVFLLILYSFPASLLLFWTWNNIFTTARCLIQDRNHISLDPMRSLFASVENVLSRTLNRARS